MITRLVLAATLLVGALSAAAPALAQSKKEIDARLSAVESLAREHDDRLKTLEIAGDPVAVRLQERLDSLEGQLLNLNGALERARIEMDALANTVRVLERELELRDRALGASFGVDLGGDAGPAGPPAAAPGAGPTAISREEAVGSLGGSKTVLLPEDPSAALEVAKRLLVDGKIGEADDAFGQFIARFGADPAVGEALFWKGEIAFVRRDFGSAVSNYVDTLSRFKKGARAPDAMVKLGAALAALDKKKEACDTLDAFKKEFPKAEQGLVLKAQQYRANAGCG